MTDIPTVPQMTMELECLLADIERDLHDGRNLSPAFYTAEEMDQYLDMP